MSHVQPTPFPSSAHRGRVTALVAIGAVAVVALAIVGGGALLLSRGSDNVPVAGAGATPTPASTPPPTPTLAPTPSPTANPDEALVAALGNVTGYDAARLAALYEPNAVIHETTAGLTQTGLDEIAARFRYFADQKFQAVVTSAPIRQDNFVAVFAKYGTWGDLSGRALVVYELKDGKVLHQWVYPAP